MFLDEQLTKGMSARERLELMIKEVAKINRELPSYKRIAKIKLRKTEFEKTTSRKISRVGLGSDDTDDANI
jgi:long-chain acyl-CoA synthetase